MSSDHDAKVPVVIQTDTWNWEVGKADILEGVKQH